ncbi:hypothetical protein Tco_0122226 [Tanacetum coccineum]
MPEGENRLPQQLHSRTQNNDFRIEVKLNIFFSEQIKYQLTLLNLGPEGESETIDLEICKFTVKKIEAQVSKCVAHTGLCQPAVTPTVVLERKGLQRKEGSDYMELKGEHDLEFKTSTDVQIHILNAYATLKTRTFYIVEASDRRLSGNISWDHLLYVYMQSWKNTLHNVNETKKDTENTELTLLLKTSLNKQIAKDTNRLTNVHVLPESTRNEEFKNPGEAIEQSNKATKRTLFPKEPEDQKKTE